MIERIKPVVRLRIAIALGVIALALGVSFMNSKADREEVSPGIKLKSQSNNKGAGFRPTETQWATLSVQPVDSHRFRTELSTDGKIAVDDDHSTPVFSPYAGRVTKLLVAPGDTVQRGKPLFVLDAADSVQAQNDFITAVAGVNKAQSQVHLTETVERRLHNLFDDKAIALKDWQQAQADRTASQNDLRTAQTTLEAMRNRLRILGKTGEEIDTFQRTGAITPDSTIYAPIGGTVVQRKVGPGQYINAGSSDPVFVIGDLSTVWLVAFVRESDASKVKVGQKLQFSVLAYPNQTFEATINYIAATLDPSSRRRTIRATLDNSNGLFNPEMFASVTIIIDVGNAMPAVPLEAVIYEGDTARVWVARDDQTVELRKIHLGIAGGRLIQVIDGLKVGEKVVTRGSLFIDRMASGDRP